MEESRGPAEAAEYTAIRQNYCSLVEVISRGNIPGALFEKGLIENDLLCPAPGITQSQYGSKLLQQILTCVKLKPKDNFVVFCQALQAESVAEGVLSELKSTYQRIIQERTGVLPSGPGPFESPMYQEVKCKLELLHKTYLSSGSNDAKESAIKLIKDQMQMFILKSLKTGLDPEKVKSEIDALCYKEAVIPSILLEWVVNEFDEKIKKIEEMSSSKESDCTQLQTCDKESRFFEKDILYHAGLCCEAVSTCEREDDVRQFFKSKSPSHSLEEISFCVEDLVKPYLVAKQGKNIYVAFKSDACIAKFKRIGYDEALKSQASHVPVRFLTELLWSHHTVILTGFSFGGLLACCVMANLWQESRISADILLKQATCITFGVPFMKIQLIDQVLRMSPDLKKSVHSVYLKEDLFPQIMGYVSLAGSTHEIEQSTVMARPQLQEAEDKIQGGASSVLARTKRVRVMTESLINLQEICLQKQTEYSKISSPALRPRMGAIKDLNNLKEEIMIAPESTPEGIVRLVYGACYVVLETDAGLTWQESDYTTPQILALQLTYQNNILVKRIDALHQSLFKKHMMEHYNKMVLRSYLDKPKKYVLPSPQVQACKQVKMLMPTLKRAELHEYPKEQVLVLEGENLWFTYKIILDDGGRYEFPLVQPHSVTKSTLQFNFPPSKEVSSAIIDGGKVKITLHTHFLTRVVMSVECKKKPFAHSVRQMQLAKLTPSQVIKLAYLSTLLEQQQPESNTTKRNFKMICFLDEAVRVVPVESVLDAIAYARHDIAVECAEALKASKLTLQPTTQMIIGLLQALFRAIYGISGEAVEELINENMPDDPERSAPPPFRMHKFYMGAFGEVPGFPVPGGNSTMPGATHPPESSLFGSDSHHESALASASSSSSTTHAQPGGSASSTYPHAHKAESLGSSSVNPLYTEVVTGKASAHMSLALTPSTALQQRMPPFHPVSLEQNPVNANKFLMSVLHIVQPTFILDPKAYPENIYFPDDITSFLQSSLEGLIERAQKVGHSNLEVVGKTHLEEIYPGSTTIRRNMLLESPRRVLAQSISKLAHFIQEMHMEENFSKPKKTNGNMQMLKLIKDIYNLDVSRCAALLGAFMERCIKIPFLKSPAVTAKAVSSPMAVGVWALFSLSREELQKMLESSQNTELVINVKEYMHGVLTDKSPDDREMEEQRYAGKLQFLLQGMHRTVTSSTKYVSYSLEYQLCNNLKFSKDTSVQDLISMWDKIFKDDILCHVAKSHRPLLARWLKWTILVHDLREVLAEYTCISVTGLINSGKSLLVKQLFNLKRVQVGTLKSKQTTVPLLYNLNIGSLDVIDFPGMDDNDECVPDLAQLMLTLSQMIVFVVDYRRISATAIKLWVDKMKSDDDVPVLICLTHADNLYLECVAKEKEYKIEAIEDKRKAIQRELQTYREVIGTKHSWNVDFYAFTQVPTVKREDLEAVGIRSPTDVGKWLVEILKNKLDQGDLAEQLQTFFTNRKRSCNSQ